jgi:hypothetical protein
MAVTIREISLKTNLKKTGKPREGVWSYCEMSKTEINVNHCAFFPKFFRFCPSFLFVNKDGRVSLHVLYWDVIEALPEK